MKESLLDKYGNDVGYNKRLQDILNRYGAESNTYLQCSELINKLNKKNMD